MSPRLKAGVVLCLRLAFAAGVLGFLVHRMSHTKLLEQLSAARPGFILLGVGVVIIDGAVRAWNWTQLMRAMRVAPRVPFLTVWSVHWAGAFLGQLVPSSMGTDAMRATIASHRIGGHMSVHWAAIAMLNVMSLVTSCIIALGCSAWLAYAYPGQGMRAPLVIVFACAISAAVIGYWLLRSQRGLYLRVLRMMRGRFRKVRRALRRFTHRILVFDRYHVPVAPVFAVAAITLATRATAYSLVGIGVGLTLPVPAWLALVPAHMLSGLIPYSVSGYGGDQAAIVYVVTGFGAPADTALALALMIPLMTLGYDVLGGFCVLFGKFGTRPAAVKSPELRPVD